MDYRGINLENLKRRNRSAVLQVLLSQGAMCRKDIARYVELTPASISIICTEFLEEGIIVELGEEPEEKRAGRKKILVDINKDYKYVLCIGIELNDTYLSVVNLEGDILISGVVPTDTAMEPVDYLRRIASECKALLWEGQIPRDKILAAGVSVPGKVDRSHGINLKAYSIWKQEVPIKEILEKELGFDVLVENSARAYARTEMIFGTGRRREHVMMLRWGPGVGSAIIINGEVHYGATDTAGEIGHIMMRKKGKLCRCGRTGCLETEISTHAIMDAIERAYEEAEASGQEMTVFRDWISEGHTMRYDNAEEWGSLEDETVQRILDEKLEIFAIAVRNSVAFSDPDKIVVWGYLFDIPGVFERFRKVYSSYDLERGDDFIVKSELDAKHTHTEALSIVIDELI